MANSLISEGHDVSVLLGKYVYDKEMYIHSTNVRIMTLPIKKSYLNILLNLINPLTYFSILQKIKTENPDVIHLMLDDAISGVVFYLLRTKKVKLIWTEHDPILHSGESYLIKYYFYISKRLLRTSSLHIIVHGERLKQILIDQGVPQNKIGVVPHGEFSYYTQWSEDVTEEENTVLFFGRIQEYKGLEYLIRSVPIVKMNIPTIKVLIAGEGDIPQCDEILEHAVNFEIHNHYIPDHEVAHFFQRAKAIILPYIDGTQTGIIPVAYSFKKPVIVTDVGSIAEVVEDSITGIIVPPKDSESIAQAIIKILQNNTLKKSMGECGYIKMKNELSWDIIAKKTIDIYMNAN